MTNNSIIHLHSHVLFLTSNLRSLNILNLNFRYIDPKAFDNSNINIIVTKDHYICCIVHSRTLCTAFQPWFISCSDILPSLGMKIFYITLCVLIIVLNFLSVILQIISYHKLRSNKTFSVIATAINANDILCAVYLSFVWIADLSFSDSFQANQESWRSSCICFTAFTTIVCFTVLAEILLVLMSLTRLMVVISPLNTKFKDILFIAKLLFFIVLFSLVFSISITLFFMYTHGKITINLCLPFLDPTGSHLIIKLIIWFTFVTQMATSIGILIMHFLLVNALRQSQRHIQKFENDDNVPLIIQLVMITTSNILC